MQRRDVEDALFERGVEQGTITFEELNEMLPAEYLPLDEMERFLDRLKVKGIRVVDRKHDGRQRHVCKRVTHS